MRPRGGDADGFAARKLLSEHIDAADLVLTATADQQEYVVALRADAAARTFVLGEFGRLLAGVDPAALPDGELTPDAVYARGVALVEAVDAARRGAGPLPADDLDDPWGRGDQTFSRVADEIEETVVPLARLLHPVLKAGLPMVNAPLAGTGLGRPACCGSATPETVATVLAEWRLAVLPTETGYMLAAARDRSRRPLVRVFQAKRARPRPPDAHGRARRSRWPRTTQC